MSDRLYPHCRVHWFKRLWTFCARPILRSMVFFWGRLGVAVVWWAANVFRTSEVRL